MRNLDKPFVFIELLGGLGNQLFQFAAGSVLSRKLSRELFVDCKNVIFTHVGEGISKLLPKEVKKINAKNSFFRKLNKNVTRKDFTTRYENSFKEKCHVYIESDDERNPSKVLELTANNLYLKGYFQSYLIVDEFKKNNSLKFVSQIPEIVTLINKIKIESPVVFHVRRGDFLNSSKTLGILSTKYYENAYDACRDSSNDRIIMFTDSESIVFNEFKASKLRSKIEIVKINPSIPAWHYMTAMSNANKIVNSNSTFSWWASSISSAKNIVAPSCYFRDKSIAINNNLERLNPLWMLVEPVWTSKYDSY